MSWQTDPVYLAALATYEAARSLPPDAYQRIFADANLFAAFANLQNHLPLIEANDSRVVDANGNLTPTYSAALAQWRNTIASAVAAAAATVSAVQANPEIAATVRSFYTTFFGREPDAGGWEFWTHEIASGRNTAAGVQSAFMADQEALNYRLAHPNVTPPVAPVSPALPPVTVTPAGFLNSKVFGIDVKLILLGGVAAYFLLGEK